MTWPPSGCTNPRPGGMLGPLLMQMTRPTRGHQSSCPPPPWRSVVMGLLAAAVLVVGCAKKAGPGYPATEAPADAMAEGAEAEPAPAEDGGDWGDDSLVQAQTELEGYEDALLEAGVELPGDVAQARADMGKSSVAAGAGAGADADRCQRRCDLATNICGLSDRICALADDHGREARYARVCDRATLDCDRATEACEGCEG